MMDCAVNAQSLITISLRKIHNSRTQRGGIKLHKNLLVSYVLRNARQVYMSEKYAEIYGMHQYEEVHDMLTISGEIQGAHPLEIAEEMVEGSGGQQQQQEEEEEEEESSACSPLVHQPGHMDTQLSKESEPEHPLYRLSYPSTNYDPSGGGGTHCTKTTVLDLDTHTVTTVDNGYLQDCACCCANSSSGGRKRKSDSGSGFYPSEAEDFSPVKRVRFEDYSGSGQTLDCTDPSNISNLISIFGSGFSGLVSRADSEQLLQAEVKQNGQLCGKQALASLGAWTRAIVAF
ncbi:immediate early response gene 5-like protein [Heptranchias perlo]|uniref:immediate early response gene 5-like protein n=1 Tax=Heptranchias perlo TaxID=212740 RepID=UPI0035594F24